MFQTPQTEDGWITSVRPLGRDTYSVDVSFPVGPAWRALTEGREGEIVFAARSRLARLGINVVPRSDLAWDGDTMCLTATVRATVSTYDVAQHLSALLRRGLPVGRLVFCPAESRLTADQVFEQVQLHALQLPADYSIDGDGRFRIRPSGHVFDLGGPLSIEDLMTIAVREDGKDLLNRMQIRREVDQIILPPRDGVITSCSMFLHRHYVVLDPEAGPLGQHLEAVVLDPVSTRGMDVFLEFTNDSEQRIVNPAVKAEIYNAMPMQPVARRWYGTGVSFPAQAKEMSETELEYTELVKIFDAMETESEAARYSHRVVAIVDDPLELLGGKPPARLWNRPSPEAETKPLLDVSSRLREGVEIAGERERGTTLLADVPKHAKVTLLLGYFPNLVEHLEICAAALQGKIKRILFRRASFEHGSFLSARDHGRLADYEGLGIDVFWCHDDRRHVVRHVFRGLRGYFVEAQNVERFQTSLIFASYGSARALPDTQLEKMRRLYASLHDFFGSNVAIMTGGGPGSMQQATDIAQEMGMLVGASFIETEDQKTNRTANFYQTFQGRSRQARQRWFEIASFHLFFMGGVGTLEEVGLTLTDMKLGVIELSPLVFFGRHGEDPYWAHLQRQLDVMVQQGRAPEWLQRNLLMTNEPADVPAFYKRILELG